MLARNEVDLRSLRAIKAAILVAKTSEGANGEISETDEQKLLQKLAKQRKDSLDIFRQQNREDLAVKEEEELAVIERYLPKQMDEAEIRTVLTGIIAQVGASGPGDMGKVMGVATKQLAGKADGKIVSGLVKELLAK
jgi:uncharacterized protein YqeY